MHRRGLVVRRALGHRLLVVAASATALFAVTVLAALGGYTASVTGEGLRATLAGATWDEAGTRITTSVAARDIPAEQRKVTAAVAKVYGRVPVAISLSARGDSYAVPGQEHSAHPQLTAFATYSGIEGHAHLTGGRWPTATTGHTVEAAVPVKAARAMRLHTGQVVTLHSRVGGPPVTVRITGQFTPGRADDYFWGGDKLVTTGVERLGYTTFGPLVVPPATFTTRFTTSVTARWLVLPSVREIRSGRLADVAARARALPATLGSGSGGSGYAVKSSVADLLTQVDRALLVSRSTLLIPALQLVVLAVYTLMLVARLLAEHRRLEITLMRARGASTRQIAALAVGEGLLLGLPAAVAAPFLAPLLVRAAMATPLFGTPGLRVDLAPTLLTWAIAVAGALVCVVAITLPPLRGIRRTYVATMAARGRGERRAMLQRAGADLALVVLAALAVWQLAHYGGPVTATAAAGAGIDPLIVAGPALALLAGGVVILRLVPVVSRAGERATTRGRGLAPALGTRQVSRRPLRTAGPALLLVMTVAVGVLSVVTGVTWRQSQIDQADFQAGTDLRIDAPSDQGSPAPPGQGGRYARLPGVTAVSPVLRDTASTGSTDVTLLAADAGALGRLMRTRAGLPPGVTWQAMSARLAATGTGLTGVPVPGRPSRLSVGLRFGPSGSADPASVSLVVSDALHTTYEIEMGAVPADGATHTKVIDLSALAGRDGVLSYPLAVRGLRFTYVRTRATPAARLAVTSLRPGTAGGFGPALRRPSGAHWSGQVTLSAGVGSAIGFGSGGLVTARLPATTDPTTPMPQVSGGVVLRAGPAAAGHTVARPGPIPAIVTRDLAARAHVTTGGRLDLTENGVDQPLTVAGIVAALPSTTPGAPAVLVDWTGLGDEALVNGLSVPPPTEWWLATRGADPAAAARVLGAHPSWTGTTVDRAALRHRLRDAPLGGALQGALILGFGAALVFAAIGFAVNTAVSARERAGEFAILRALGVRGRQVLGLVAVEQAFLVGMGLAGGLLLGIVVARLVVPHVVLTVSATAPYPPAQVILRWPVVLAMLAAIVVLLTAVLLLLVRSLRRGGPGQTLRLGEDR
ncbi:ABC transporter permease [Actinoallomurus oryzae]|uniref:ABC transporter permease n=1 Tax=Actinoallomurus oryzae TaxID=502180 RepID=A0ABP8PY86_9ACTN